MALHRRERLSRAYTRLLSLVTAGRGLPWRIAPDTVVRIDPRCRWIRHPGYEAAVVEYLRARVRAGDCCVDVGAHVGFYVLQMASWTGVRGRVIAFEPNPTARRILLANVGLNRLHGRVAVEPAAIAAHAGTAPLYHGADASGLSRLGSPNPEAADGGSRIDVPVDTLDGYCASHDLRPDWIVIDTEGFELEVLRGARRLLAGRATFVVEMHAQLWRDGGVGTAIGELADAHGRRIIALTGQRDPLREYGTVAL